MSAESDAIWDAIHSQVQEERSPSFLSDAFTPDEEGVWGINRALGAGQDVTKQLAALPKAGVGSAMRAALMPADLLFHGGLSLMEALGDKPMQREGWAPSELATAPLEAIGGVYQPGEEPEAGLERFSKGAGDFLGNWYGFSKPLQGIKAASPKAQSVINALSMGPESAPKIALTGAATQGATAAALPNEPLAQALIPLATTLGVEGVKGAASKLKQVISPPPIPKNDINLAVKEALSAFTDPQSLQNALATAKPGPMGPYMRTAEIANDPGLALLTQTLEEAHPNLAGTRAANLDTARANQLANKFNVVQGVPETPEKIGQVIQESASANKKIAQDKIAKLYERAFAKPTNIKLGSQKVAINKALESLTKNGAKIDPEVQNLVQRISRTPREGIDLKTLNAFRQEAGEMAGTLRGADQIAQKRGHILATKIFGILDNAEIAAVESAGKGQGISKAQAALIKKARKLTAEKGIAFEEKAVGNILEKNRYGRLEMNASQVLREAKASPEAARQVAKAIRGQPRGVETFASGLMEHLKTTSTSPGASTFNAGTFRREWRKLRNTAVEILYPRQVKAIDFIADDLSKQINYATLKNRATQGQSKTSGGISAANLLKESAVKAISPKLFLLDRLVGLGKKAHLEELAKQVDDGLIEVAFNPKHINVIMAAKANPTKSNMAKLADLVMNEIKTKSGRVGATAAKISQDNEEPEYE